MLSVRRLTEETLGNVKLLADAVLIGEETMLRTVIAPSGISPRLVRAFKI